MLPITTKTRFVKSAAKSAMALTTAAALALTPALPAHAWGKKEQGIVTGLAAGLLIAGIIANESKAKPAPVVTPTPVYVPPPTYTNVYTTPAAQAFNSYNSTDRRAIQSRLAAYGYYKSSIDGSFGPNTYNAVMAYANAKGGSSQLSTAAGAYGIYDSLLF